MDPTKSVCELPVYIVIGLLGKVNLINNSALAATSFVYSKIVVGVVMVTLFSYLTCITCVIKILSIG